MASPVQVCPNDQTAQASSTECKGQSPGDVRSHEENAGKE